ncbi:MAG: peptide deformylase [Candidatus Binatia bacterium]
MSTDPPRPDVPSLPRILQIGEPLLRSPARELAPEEIRSDAVQRLIQRMRDTMRDAPGVGLAAPQIGEPLQLAVIEDREEYLRDAEFSWLAERERAAVPFCAIVNPKLAVTLADPREFFEGCLSVAGFTALVPRARAVRVECLDEHGRPRVIEARGWHARILQHEIDHLRGVLYVDRMAPRTLMTTANYARYWKDHSLDELRAALDLVSPSAPAPDS